MSLVFVRSDVSFLLIHKPILGQSLFVKFWMRVFSSFAVSLPHNGDSVQIGACFSLVVCRFLYYSINTATPVLYRKRQTNSWTLFSLFLHLDLEFELGGIKKADGGPHQNVHENAQLDCMCSL